MFLLNSSRIVFSCSLCNGAQGCPSKVMASNEYTKPREVLWDPGMNKQFPTDLFSHLDGCFCLVPYFLIFLQIALVNYV